MQWLTLRKEQAPAHRPVKCLEGQTYRKFWTKAGGSQPCRLSTTTDALVRRDGEFTTDMTVGLTTVSVGNSQSLKPTPHKTSKRAEEMAVTSEAEIRPAPESETEGHDGEFTTDMEVYLPIMSEGTVPPLKASLGTTLQRVIENAVTKEAEGRTAPASETEGRKGEFTTDMAVDLPIISVGIAPPLKASPGVTLHRVIENAVTMEGEHRPAPESETGDWASLLSWNVNTLTVFVILPITLGVAVFVSLLAVNYVLKRDKDHRIQYNIQEKDKHNTGFFSHVSLLNPQLTADHAKQHTEYLSVKNYGVSATEYHVYERID